jgi:hypothetical protein
MSQQRFDPYALLHELQDRHVTYVIVGGLARVLRGSDELTRNIDLTPHASAQNVVRLGQALENVGARRSDGRDVDLADLDPSREPILHLTTNVGDVNIVLEPAGTRGYEDLRRRATHEPIGDGLRPKVAGAGDLVRMLEAVGRDHDRVVLETMQRVVELDRGLSWER